jgi:death-on-curing protein
MAEEIIYPSVEQVSRLYDRIIAKTGGERGYLSRSNLHYLLDTVQDVGEKLPRRQAIVKKAAFLLYNVIVIHPFFNGNKRTAYALVELFLKSNEFEISSQAKDAYQFLIGIASGKVSESEVEGWIVRHLTELKGE